MMMVVVVTMMIEVMEVVVVVTIMMILVSMMRLVNKVDLWMDPVGVAAPLDVWGEKLGGPRAGV